jgi:hypothetical protein
LPVFDGAGWPKTEGTEHSSALVKKHVYPFAMNDIIPTLVRVRAQAHGGKYIGPSVATAPILSVLAGGRPITGDVTIPNQSSGTVVTQQGAVTSPYPIIVGPQSEPSQYYPMPGAYWLDPPAEGLADVIVPLPLAVPTAVEFRVKAFAPEPMYSSVTVMLLPGQSYLAGPGIVVPVKGLYTPAFTAQFDSSLGVVNVQATVQMMCGCPITQQPAAAKPAVEPYWPSTEFDVAAIFVGGAIPVPIFQTVPLTCTETNTYTASPKLDPGSYTVWLNAFQPGTMNSGSATTTVTVP